MFDPLSVAAGAAIGGATSKVVEKAWDSAERWLKEKFGTHAEEAQKKARANAAYFIRKLADRVEELEKRIPKAMEQIALTQTHPQFSAMLQTTVLNAAQTDSQEKLDLLASLVAQRLSAKAETTLSLASGLASDAIAQATISQLQLMALCCLIDEIRPRDLYSNASDFKMWLRVHFERFSDYEFKEIDAKHLVAIKCASYDPASNRSLALALTLKAGSDLLPVLHECDYKEIEPIDVLHTNWSFGLAGVQLTSVGSIVGGLVLGRMTAKSLDIPDWS